MKFILIFLIFTISTQSQELSVFIKNAIQNNLELKRSSLMIEEFKLEMKSAKGDLYPSLDFNARYSKAGGGRTIDFPIGDLLNPVYNGLFQITSNPAYNINLKNQSIRFLREKEHDTKISLTQIIDYRLWLISDLKEENIKLSQTEKLKIQTRIISDVIDTYLTLSKLENIKISLKENFEVLKETKRSSKALYDSDIVTKVTLLEVDVQILSLKKELLSIDKTIRITKKYLNHLLNRDLNHSINIQMLPLSELKINRDELLNSALNDRTELQLLNLSTKMMIQNSDISDAAFYPQFIIKADYGFQGESYSFDANHDYWMVSGILNYNLFNGFSDEYNSQISESKVNRLRMKKKEAEQKIEIELDNSILNYQLQLEQMKLSEKQVSLAFENYRMTKKKFDEGLSSQLELMNAFTLKKNAQINYESDKIDLIKLKYKIDSVSGKLIKEFM